MSWCSEVGAWVVLPFSGAVEDERIFGWCGKISTTWLKGRISSLNIGLCQLEEGSYLFAHRVMLSSASCSLLISSALIRFCADMPAPCPPYVP